MNNIIIRYFWLLLLSILIIHLSCKKQEIKTVFDFISSDAAVDAYPDKLRSDNQILAFMLQGQIKPPYFSQDTIYITVSRDVYFNSLHNLRTNKIVLSEGASVLPKASHSADYSKPVIYTVTAENGDKLSYVVVVNYDVSEGNEILNFLFEGQQRPAVYKNDSVIIKLPEHIYKTGKLNLEILDVSENASVTPEQGSYKDYFNTVDFVVTSEKGVRRTYKVVVTNEAQLPKFDWVEKNRYNPSRVANRYYKELKGWASYNPGFFFTSPDNNFPLQQIKGKNGGQAVQLRTCTYHNIADFNRRHDFGIVPGALFTGYLADYDQVHVTGRDYRRGRHVYQSVPFNGNRPPISLSFDYKYVPQSGLKKMVPGDYSNFFRQKWGSVTSVAGKDAMDIYVILEHKQGSQTKRLGVAWMRSEESQNNWMPKIIPFKYAYGSAPSDLKDYEKQGAITWGNIKTDRITHMMIVFTSSYRMDIGAPGSQLSIDNVILNY